MNCKQIKPYIFPYAEGNLNTLQMELVVKHIETCKACSIALSIVNDSLEIINNQKELRPNPFIYTRIAQRIIYKNNHTIFIRKILKPVIISLTIAVALMGGILIGKINNTTSPDYIYSSSIENYYWNDINQEPIEVTLLDVDQNRN